MDNHLTWPDVAGMLIPIIALIIIIGVQITGRYPWDRKDKKDPWDKK